MPDRVSLTDAPEPRGVVRGQRQSRRSRTFAAWWLVRALSPIFVFIFSILARPAPSIADEHKEVRVSVRPYGIAPDLQKWAYRRHTKLQILGTDKDFDKATEGLTVFVYDPKAPLANNCILKAFMDERHETAREDIHLPMDWRELCSGGGGDGSPKGAGANAARALAQVGAVANLSSPEGEKGGSPYGVAGGMNPNAESSPGLQAAVATVQIALSASEMKQIVERATRFIAARLTTKAEIEAVEKAALEGIEQLAKDGKAVSREAIEEAAREAARKAEQALPASGGGKVAGGAANGVKTVHVPGPRKPPPLGASGTPIRTSGETTATKAGQKAHIYTPDRPLPVDRKGVPIPDVDAPHTQLGRSRPKFGGEPQAREWGYGSNGKLQPKRDIDFSDHGHPDVHPNPHQHELTPNNPTLAPKGGYRRGDPEAL